MPMPFASPQSNIQNSFILVPAFQAASSNNQQQSLTTGVSSSMSLPSFGTGVSGTFPFPSSLSQHQANQHPQMFNAGGVSPHAFGFGTTSTFGSALRSSSSMPLPSFGTGVSGTFPFPSSLSQHQANQHPQMFNAGGVSPHAFGFGTTSTFGSALHSSSSMPLPSFGTGVSGTYPFPSFLSQHQANQHLQMFNPGCASPVSGKICEDASSSRFCGPLHFDGSTPPSPVISSSNADYFSQDKHALAVTPTLVSNSGLEGISNVVSSGFDAAQLLETPIADHSQHNDGGPGLAPDVESEVSEANTRSGSRWPAKQMKTTSKATQFFTTIVIKVCLNCRETQGMTTVYRRSVYVFKNVERGLRDRIVFPCPDDVSKKDLMEHSYFQGPRAEAEFEKYCKDESSHSLEEAMTSHGERLYANKFTDVKKTISNYVLPKWEAILKATTGNGTKSGYRLSVAHSCLLHS